MKKLVHQSPLGALEIVGVPGAIEPGEPFAVTDELAARLLEQPELYQPATKAQITAAAKAASKGQDA